MFHAYVQRFDGMDEKFLNGELRPCLIHFEIQKVFKILCHIKSCGTHAWSIKYKRKQKLITQFICKSRDKSFDHS